MSAENKQNSVLDELGDFEKMIEERAYHAVCSGVSKAMNDMGFSAPQQTPAKPKQKQDQPAEKPKSTMRARRRGRKGRATKKSPFELTSTQEEVLKTIQEFVDKNDKSPTYSEIAEDLDKSGVATIVHAIADKGWIGLDDSKFSRKIEVLHRV